MKTKMILGIVLAASAIFMVNCAGKQQQQTTAQATGRQEIVSIIGELTELCNANFIEANFCGIGTGTSTSESMATQIANTQARENLAGSVQSSIEAMVRTFGMNDPSGEALEGAAMRAVARVGGEVADIRTQRVRTLFDSETNRFTVYVLVTSSRTAALDLARQHLRASEELAQINRTLNLSTNVERILDPNLDRIMNLLD
jgi:hypothetical protein